MTYDTQNIFARILRGEIPCKKIYDNDHALAFHDIHPQAAIHALVIPKGAYADHNDFISRASDTEIAAFQRAVLETVKLTGVLATGYRLIANNGAHAHQEVPHYHVHILGGQPLGSLLVKI